MFSCYDFVVVGVHTHFLQVADPVGFCRNGCGGPNDTSDNISQEVVHNVIKLVFHRPVPALACTILLAQLIMIALRLDLSTLAAVPWYVLSNSVPW